MCSSIVSMKQSVLEIIFMRAIPHSRLKDVRTKISNIDFFLKILPLKGDELVKSKMQKKNGSSPTSFWREHAWKNA